MRSLSNNKGVFSIADRIADRQPEHKQLRCRPGPLPCIHFFLWGCVLFSSLCFGAGESRTTPEGIEIRTQAHPETAAIGDPVRIDLEVAAPRGYKIEIPEPEKQAGDFFILEFLPGPAIPASDKTGKETQFSGNQNGESQRYRARIVAAVYKTGTFLFPEIRVYVLDDQGRKTTTASPPVEIEIRSVLTGNDTDLRDLKKQADIPGEFPWLLIAILAATACILGAAAWYIRRKYHRSSIPGPSTPARDPLVVAEEELRDLLARRWPENGLTKKFYVLLSEIVKRIVHAAYGIATEERTTIEIMDSLHRLSGLAREIPEAIQSLLLQCDIVKFAKYIPSNSENDHAAEEAYRILAHAKEHSRQSVVGSDGIGVELEGSGNEL